MRELTKAQRSLTRIVQLCGPIGISKWAISHNGLEADFERCRKAGMLVSSGYEVSTKSDDWLNSTAGRAALAARTSDGGEG